MTELSWDGTSENAFEASIKGCKRIRKIEIVCVSVCVRACVRTLPSIYNLMLHYNDHLLPNPVALQQLFAMTVQYPTVH